MSVDSNSEHDEGYRSVAERAGYREGEATEGALAVLQARIADRRSAVSVDADSLRAVQSIQNLEPVAGLTLGAADDVAGGDNAKNPAPRALETVTGHVAAATQGFEDRSGPEPVMPIAVAGTNGAAVDAPQKAVPNGEIKGSARNGGRAADQTQLPDVAEAPVAVPARPEAEPEPVEVGTLVPALAGTHPVTTAPESPSPADDTAPEGESSSRSVAPHHDDSVQDSPEESPARPSEPAPDSQQGARAPASQPMVEAPVVEEHSEAPQTRVQQVTITRGEPIRDAVVTKSEKFQFGDGGTQQVTHVPKVLIRQLRDNLAVMTNDEFAQALPVTSLLAAFVASQLGAAVAPEDSESLSLDANTRTALQAFRGIDGRTGAIERQLAELEKVSRMAEGYSHRALTTLVKYAEKSRLMENALAFLVSDRLDPVRVSGIDALRAPLVGGRYREMRDHLRRQTDQELAQEKLTEGRPRR